MSISSLGMLGTMASTSSALSKGSEVERAKTDTANQARETDADERAEAAAGIGKTEKEASAGDRDADGRRPWEPPPTSGDAAGDPASESPKSKDPTHQAGNRLDVSG